MSIVESDGAAILVSWCERNWGEYKMPMGRGGGVKSVPYFSLASRDQYGSDLNSLKLWRFSRVLLLEIRNAGNLWSHGKIRDWEQASKTAQETGGNQAYKRRKKKSVFISSSAGAQKDTLTVKNSGFLLWTPYEESESLIYSPARDNKHPSWTVHMGVPSPVW